MGDSSRRLFSISFFRHTRRSIEGQKPLKVADVSCKFQYFRVVSSCFHVFSNYFCVHECCSAFLLKKTSAVVCISERLLATADWARTPRLTALLALEFTEIIAPRLPG